LAALNVPRKPIRIAFIITGLSSGGAETMLRKLLERIDRETFVPHVVSLTDIGETGASIAALGVPVEALGMKRGTPDPIRLASLVRRLRQLKPDLVHTWMYHANLIGGAAARLAGIRRVIWSVYSSALTPAETSLSTKLTVRWCARLSSWLPDCVQYDSRQAQTYHRSIGYRERVSLVIPNGVDLAEFVPNPQARLEVRRELDVPPDALMVGLVARFDLIKNHEGFVKAAERLHRDMPSVHFLMAGQDVDMSNPLLRELVEKSALMDVCHLLGQRGDIARIMASLDVVCLTSWSESFGIVLIEAMACGVPCVSTDCGEQSSILGDAGWVVPVGDMDGVAAKCAMFLALPAAERRRVGAAARARATERFELGQVARRYEQMYRDCVGFETGHPIP
jgi:glycosyltransferase involved in cell wall biosynthesis